MTKPDLTALTTEARNPRTEEIDAMSTLDLVTAINEEDRGVAAAVQQALPRLAEAVDAIEERLRKGGRLVYCGAGSSGRLGAMDAAECVPTFSAPAGKVIGLIAGGPDALRTAIEGAEDRADLGAADVAAIGIGAKDVVVGLSASGRTPYVLGALQQARAAGALTIAVVCNPDSEIAAAADIAIELATGPEIVTGSTRQSRPPAAPGAPAGTGSSSSLQRVQVFDVDRAQVAEQHHQDRQADRRLRGGDRQDEEDEHLARDVAQEMREGDEIHVHREQHQLDRHQQDDHVLAVEEDADHGDREQQRAEHQEMGERQRHQSSFALAMDTSRTRSSRRARTCSAGSWARESLRWRSVSAMAATIATSSTTAAISNASR
jgi:D-arabinose 5-phosphate isomerase GutQ